MADILNIRDYVSKTKRESVAGSGEVYWLDGEQQFVRMTGCSIERIGPPIPDTAPSDWPFVDCPYTAPGGDCA